nr:hypothetical protein [Paenibacillus xylanexedens]
MGDNVRGWEGVRDRNVCDGNWVMYRDGVELEWKARGLRNRMVYNFSELVEVKVGGEDMDVRVRYGNKWVVEILLFNARWGE